MLRRKEDLELQSNDLNLPLPEARERLQNRIKQDNAELKQMDKDAFELQKMVEIFQNNIKEIDQDLKESNAGTNKDESKKYEVLYQKEQEINQFTEQFESEKDLHEKEIKEHQHLIASLLEHMQKTMAKQNKLPTQEEYKEMKSDLKFKQGQLEDNETTAARLKVQKDNIEQDLNKVKNLEGRIHTDM